MYKVGLSDMGRNGFMNQIMQEDQNTNRIIEDFRVAIENGLNPNDVSERILDNYNTSFAAMDKTQCDRIVKKVEAMYAAKHS